MLLSLTVAGIGRLCGGDLRRVVEVARVAEDAGWDQVVLPDHLAIGRDLAGYPYGQFPLPDDEPWLEPLTTLAAIAQATERIRLGTGVLVAPLRPPALLAKQAATLDVLSGGRLDLGIGVGWQQAEFVANGMDPADRWRAFDEQLEACRSLWVGGFAEVTTRAGSVEVRSEPTPVQPGGPPLWFGTGLHAASLDRMARHASGWLPMERDPSTLADQVRSLRAGLRARGKEGRVAVRGHGPLVRSNGGHLDVPAVADAAAPLEHAGVTHLAFPLAALVRDLDDLPAALASIRRGFAPSPS